MGLELLIKSTELSAQHKLWIQPALILATIVAGGNGTLLG